MRERRPVAPEGFDPNASIKALAVLGNGEPSGRSTRSSLLWGLLWCSIGSACVPLAPIAANVLVAFGMVVAARDRGVKEQALVLCVSLAAGCSVSYALFGAFDIPSTVVAVLCAFAVAQIYVARKLNAGSLLAIAGVAALAMACQDFLAASKEGMTIAEVINQMVSGMVDTSSGSLDISTTTALIEARNLMVSYWPTLYAATGLALTVFSLMGAFLALVTSRVERPASVVANYDVPLVVPMAFAFGVAAELSSAHLPAGADVAALAGANVVMISRIALAQQGISVLVWWLRERRVGLAVRTALVFAALWLEMSLALVSLVGLLDVMINFRRLPRRRPNLVVRPMQER